MPTTTQTGGLSSQTLEGADGANKTDIIYGDANKLKGTTIGGDDTIIGGDDGAINYLYGDAYSMEGSSMGGADLLVGGSFGSKNYIFGDAYNMKGKVFGGNDMLYGGLDSKNILYGDAYIMQDGAIGGADQFFIGNGIVFIAGESVSSLSGAKIEKEKSFNLNISDNSIIGDASYIFNSKGGNDFINYANGLNIFLDSINSKSVNKNSVSFVDLKVDFSVSSNEFFGDAKIMNDSLGGDDIFIVANSILIAIDDVESISLGAKLSSANAKINFSLIDNTIIGDATVMNHSVGGLDIINLGNRIVGTINDVISHSDISGFSNSSAEIVILIEDNRLYGDAINLCESTGSDDIILVGSNILSQIWSVESSAGSLRSSISSASIDITLSNNSLMGDAKFMSQSIGGNDVLVFCSDFVGLVEGQAAISSSNSLISHSVTLSISDNNLYGDAEIMINSVGGSDSLTIGRSIVDKPLVALHINDNTLYGDAKFMKNSTGGDDLLIGAFGKGSVTYLYGDARYTDGKSKAGNDFLISETGNDQMWGDFASVLNPATSSNDHEDDDGGYGWDEHESDHDDDHHAPNPYKYAGKDTFVFKENNGNDTIFDFQHGLDKIDLSAANIFSVDGLHIEQSAAHPSDSVIDLGGGNSITLVGVSNVVETDFVFAGISI